MTSSPEVEVNSPEATSPSPSATNDIQTDKRFEKYTAPVDLVVGELVAEGGFCSIFELTGIKNLETGEWLLKPPAKESSPSPSKPKHKRGASTTLSLMTKGPSTRRVNAGNHHRRGKSTGALLATDMDPALPPLMNFVEITVMHPISVNPSNTNTNDSNESTTTSSPTKMSPFRRSGTREAAQETLRKAPPMVMKFLKQTVFGNTKALHMGLKDMQIEIDILQKLNHPHIVTAFAYGTMMLEGYSKPYPFVILDRLGETLENKLNYWETKHKKNSSLMGKMVMHRKHDKTSFFAKERWTVLRDMASALAYMHGKKIAYRDVKPENVAFDRFSGQLKLIDLGLAKDLRPLRATKKGLYRLTPLTGSARYMAPEVARELDYNESCDVYGMAIVIWQVMALETPFAKFTVQKMFQVVYDTPHVRPSLDEWKPEVEGEEESDEWLAHLLFRMWNPIIQDRPSMKEVHSILAEQVERVETEETQKVDSPGAT